MNTNKLITLAVNLELAAMLMVISACKSSGGGAGEATAAGLQTSAAKIEASTNKIDNVLASLNNLVNSPTNLPVQFAAYNTSVKDMETSAADMNTRVTAARAKGNEYFKQWDAKAAEIKNEDVKKSTEARKQELQERFTKIKLSYTQLEDAYKPLMSDLKDIQSALATDLSTGGVNVVKGAAVKANEHAVPFKKAVGDLAAQFKELGASMSAMTPAPAPAGTPAPAPAK